MLWIRIDEKKYSWKKNLIFVWSKNNFLIHIPQASIKDIQATREAFSHQKRTSTTYEMKFMNFLYFCGSFLPSLIRIRIRTANRDPNTDPGTPLNPDPIRIWIHNTTCRESFPVLTLALISFSHWAMRLAGQMMRVVLVFIRLSFPFHPASSCKEKVERVKILWEGSRFANPVFIVDPNPAIFTFLDDTVGVQIQIINIGKKGNNLFERICWKAWFLWITYSKCVGFDKQNLNFEETINH